MLKKHAESPAGTLRRAFCWRGPWLIVRTRAAVAFAPPALSEMRGGAGSESFAPDFAKNHPDFGYCPLAGRSMRQVFLEAHFAVQCYPLYLR
jgi:hypothetical protein